MNSSIAPGLSYTKLKMHWLAGFPKHENKGKGSHAFNLLHCARPDDMSACWRATRAFRRVRNMQRAIKKGSLFLNWKHWQCFWSLGLGCVVVGFRHITNANDDMASSFLLSTKLCSTCKRASGSNKRFWGLTEALVLLFHHPWVLSGN